MLQLSQNRQHATAWKKFLASSPLKPGPLEHPYTRSEAEFNADLREVLKSQGLGALHIRETDNPGAYDLLITLPLPGWPPQHLWAELKILDEELRPSQRAFQRERSQLEEVTLIIRLRDKNSIEIRSGSDYKRYLTVPDFHLLEWVKTFKELITVFYSEI